MLEWNDSGTNGELGVELNGAHYRLLLIDLWFRHLDAHIQIVAADGLVGSLREGVVHIHGTT